jgi:alpha-tubulin suppressor-like RCC1 family protein
VGGFTDWCQASAGQQHSVAVRTNGTLWAWGYNDSGQLGDFTIVSKSSPVSVVGGFTDWCQVSSGDDHSVAVRQDGTVWAWGGNSQGELGDNSEVNKSSPVSVVGGYTDWWNVSAGENFTLAIRKSCGF